MDTISRWALRWSGFVMLGALMAFVSMAFRHLPSSRPEPSVIALLCAGILFMASILIVAVGMAIEASGAVELWLMRITLCIFGCGIVMAAGAMSIHSFGYGAFGFTCLHSFNALLGCGVIGAGCMCHRLL